MSLPRSVLSQLTFCFLLASAILQLGCGGGSSSPGGGGPATITSVSVSGPPNLEAPFCANFTASVQGTGNYDHTVQWYVEDVLGGSASTGLITSNGNYCAPPQPPTNNPVTIKAVATADSSKTASTSMRIIAITISPLQAQMYVGDQQQFTASVTGGVNNTINWQVNGVPGGNSSVGTISANGVYTAPALISDVAISVEASNTDPSIFASANITVSGRIVISPPSPQLTYGSQQQFSANVQGTTDTQIKWIATYGGISPTGLYTATGTQSPDTITAWSAHARGTTAVQVISPTASITKIAPQPATALETITITGTNLNENLTAEFCDVLGSHIPVLATTVSDTSATFTVPQGAVSGDFYLLSRVGGLTPAQSNTMQFRRLARLRLHSPTNDLSSGESVTLQYALLGDSTPHTVTFTTDVGTFSGSTYTAPTVTSDSFAHIKGCITGTSSCTPLILGLHPFRISSNAPLVSAGQSLQLSALLGGGNTSAQWNLLAGGGSLSAAGLYTAGTTLQSGGPAIVSALSSGVTETATLGVTGKFPGLVNRISEYTDQNDPNSQSATPDGLAVIGNRAYVSASNYIGSTNAYYWIDVYNITNPAQPVWLTAVESYSTALLPAFGGQYLYSRENITPIDGFPDAINLYQIVNGVPVLTARTGISGSFWNTSWNQGVITMVASTGTSNRPTQELLQYDLTGGQIVFRDLNVPLPSDANYYLPNATLQVGNRLFVSIYKNDISFSDILTYDTSTTPPTLLGAVDGISLIFYSSGNYLFGAEGGMDIYDISGPLPQLQSHVNSINAANLNGTQLLAYTAQQGCLLLDISQPASPKVMAALFDGVINGCDDATFVGNYVMASEFVGGIVTYDASKSGGPVVNTQLYGGGAGWADDYDLLLQRPYLYAAAATGVGATLNVYDVSTTPATRVGQYYDPNQEAFAVQATGNYMYLGGSSYTTVLDATDSTAPALVTTLPIPVTTFARSNKTLFAGTPNNTLVVMDLTNPALPNLVNTISLPDLPIRARIFGNLLYVADNAAGLFIYDISSPQSPALLSQFTNLVLAADMAVVGNTAYVAADIDGLVILDVTNPANPVLVSKTTLGRIDPFYSDNPLNEALTVTVNNNVVYVGTINDNGIVLGLDCTNPMAPRIVSLYGHGDFILTWVGTLLFNGSQMYLGGSLGFTYPVEQVDMSEPFNSIFQEFPPAALQNIPLPSTVYPAAAKAQLIGHPHGGRFPKRVPPLAPAQIGPLPRRF